MRRIILMLLAVILISGCAREGFFISSKSLASCEGSTGGTFINLHYGDSELRTNPIAHVRQGNDFEIRLYPRRRDSDPAGINYENVMVSVSGKPTDPGAAWITAKGSYSGTSPDHKLVICVDPNQTDRVYYYKIAIDEVGVLDPRVDVDP